MEVFKSYYFVQLSVKHCSLCLPYCAHHVLLDKGFKMAENKALHSLYYQMEFLQVILVCDEWLIA